MPSIRGANLPQLGGFNQAAVLETIRLGQGSFTRADLVRQIGLSAQTVTNIVRRLIEDGMVVEAVRRRDGVGRPGTTLDILPGSRYVIGVHFDPVAIFLVLLDLAGNIVSRRMVSDGEFERPDAVLDVVAGQIAEILEESAIDRTRLLGVGIATPGPIDRDRGIVLDPPHLVRWHNVPLRDEVARRTGVPTILDKDISAVASAVLWFPQTGRPEHAAVVYAGTGIAIGVISEGEVVHGASGNAGEANHLNVGRAFGHCSCGRTGCLRGVFTTKAIYVNALARDIPVEPDGRDAPSDTVRADRAVAKLRDLAAGGHEGARGLLQEMGAALGAAVTSVCDLFDLDTVVVSGPLWERVGEWAEPALRGVLSRHPVPGKHPLRFVNSGQGVYVGAVGAACLMLDDALTPRATDLLLHS